MLASWNVRGLNKVGKLMEISSRLRELQPDIMMLLETRVKANKANKIREKIGLRGRYLDNYINHSNGRIWLYWNEDKYDIHLVTSTYQMLHCRVNETTGEF